MSEPLDKKAKFKTQIEDYLNQIPSLSTTVAKILAVCNNPASTANDLNKVVSLDPVLTGNVLKLINSAYYSNIVEKVKSLSQAIIMLGLNTIKNLALSTAVMGTIAKNSSAGNQLMDRFWAHCISTGAMAKILAIELGIPKSECEEFFVAGLLHDVGKIPIIQCFPAEYMETIKYSNEKSIGLNIIEKNVFGINHVEAGRMIADKWNFKGAIYESICCHHQPDAADTEHVDFVQKVAIADFYINKEIRTSSLETMVPEDEMIQVLFDSQGIDGSSLKKLEKSVHSEIENAKSFMQVTRG